MPVSVSRLSSSSSANPVAVAAVADFDGDGFEDFLIGDPGDTGDGQAYIVFGDAEGLSGDVDLDTLAAGDGIKIVSPFTDDQLGMAVSAIGDINGDGFADVMIGAPGTSPEYQYIYTRFDGYTRFYTTYIPVTYTYTYTVYTSDGGTYTEQRTYQGGYNTYQSYYYGTAIQYTYTRTRNDAGVAYVIFGTDADPETVDVSALGSSGLTVIGPDFGGQTGSRISGAADFDGDGKPDVLINGTATNAAVHVLLNPTFEATGSLDLYDQTSGFQRLFSTQNDSGFGYAIDAGGDINGGFADLLIAAPNADSGAGVIDSGQVFIVFGSDAPATSRQVDALDGSDGFIFSGQESGDLVGSDVAFVGDSNKNGYDDILIGAAGVGGGRGEAYLIHGSPGRRPADFSPADLNSAHGYVISSVGYGLGELVGGIGDINGDGQADFALTDEIATGRRLHIVFGRGSGSFNERLDLETLDARTGFTIDGSNLTDPSSFALSFSGGISAKDSHVSLIIGNGDGSTFLISGGYATLAAVDRLDGAQDGTIDAQYFTDPFILGSSGNDKLNGDSSDAMVFGFGGDDSMSGGSGGVALFGGGGNDRLEGGDGDDSAYGGSGNDMLFGSDGEDQLAGGRGNDLVHGGVGADTVSGGAGVDTVNGGQGNDMLVGGNGDDILGGNAGSDTIFAGEGRDFIHGGFGFDQLVGGFGADRFFHLGVRGHGTDWIQDYDASEGDVLQSGIAGSSAENYVVNFAASSAANAGVVGIADAFIGYKPTGQLLWALTDGGDQTEINIQIDGQIFDLLS